MDFLKPYTAQLLSLLRIMSGLLVLQHGTTKYLNFPAGPMNNASPMTMSGAAGLFELVGGVLVVVGLFTRPVAFLLSGMTAVAYFYAHSSGGFFPILNARRAGGALLFRFPLSRRGRWWSVERRPGVAQGGLNLETCSTGFSSPQGRGEGDASSV